MAYNLVIDKVTREETASHGWLVCQYHLNDGVKDDEARSCAGEKVPKKAPDYKQEMQLSLMRSLKMAKADREAELALQVGDKTAVRDLLVADGVAVGG